MKAKNIEQVITVCSGLSVGVTLKAVSEETPIPFDEATKEYHRKIEIIGKAFEKLGWHITQQQHDQNEYLVCAKYVLDPLDFKCIAEATKMVKQYGPPWLDKELIQY
jgi:hypothetical protein